MLTTENHDRDAVGMTYIYPVVSRRAGGVSIGVNLNPNNACNWHCVYCQVPNLLRGSAPEMNINLLNSELKEFIDELLHREFMQKHVPEDCRRVCDVAISGNGEPTGCRQFDTVVETIVCRLQAAELLGKINIVLISNGSYVHRAEVLRGLDMMAVHRGQVWFKVDAATDAGISRINGVNLSVDRMLAQLKTVAKHCPTWIQTCMFAWDGQPPEAFDTQAYLDFLQRALQQGIALQGVLLYGIARPSMQAEAVYVSALPEDYMLEMKQRIEAIDLAVKFSL
ncbi:MAG: radical SAM protein [Mariprofundaceae bacterium]|nr:radical SAM protein [Mariprofundaceae bacterium]